MFCQTIYRVLSWSITKLNPLKHPIFIIFCILYLLNSSGVYGQKFSLGIKAGPSVSWSGFGDKELKSNFKSLPKIGYSVGGLIIFPLKKKYSFLSEFGYTQKGRRLEFGSGSSENNATYHFIDLSMALRKSFHLPISKDLPTNWSFNIGPNIEYWLNGKGRIISNIAPGEDLKYEVVFNEPKDANYYKNYLNDVNRWLFGLDIGIGADAPLRNKQRIYTEFRFTTGQTFIGKKTGTSDLNVLGFEDTLQTNFKTFTILVSYTFDFDKKLSKMGRSTKDKAIKRKK